MKEKAELPSHLRLQNLCGKATSLQILAKTNWTMQIAKIVI